MPPTQTISLVEYLNPVWLMGPLAGKELRVASRRRRGYALRFVYVLALGTFIVMVWVAAVQLAGGGARSRAQMQVAAQMITMDIVWFQFYAAQLVALVLMSTTISDEVHGRTLGILMTTPLSSTDVVLNKFFSRMVQILLLVATSLPLLALVRVSTTLEGYTRGFRWSDHSLEGPDVTIWMLISMVGYLLVSLAFTWRAVRAFRRHIL